MRTLLLGTSLAFVLLACGSTGDGSAPPGNPYTSDPNTTVVVGPGAGSGTVTRTPTGEECIQLPSGECVKPQKTCRDGERADVIVDSSGKVVEVVCYPASSSPTPVDGQGNIELGKDNKAVVSIDGNDDGIDVAGDVTSKGNNVTVYGQGPAVSVIGGNVDAEGNNFAARGVTVKGNVEISGNNAALVLCVVEGDVIIKGNNATIADCTVRGKIEINGNNSVLVGNRVGKDIVLVDAQNTVCDANTRWTDNNDNGIVDPGETGSSISCSTKK
ncbi:MAG TPA: hypothetical protein VM580_16220 [Labilithrix sp.]|nr:hypothetical protein [Labilithrix sp.]